MRRLLFLSLLFPVAVAAQSTLGLSAYYPFESNLGDAGGEASNLGVPVGAVDFDCGVVDQALLLGGNEDFVRIPGGASNNVNREFDDEDFTLSLYFKSTATDGNRYLISKRDTSCADEQYFHVRYAPASRTVEATLRQGNESATLTHVITNASCWQHLALVRENNRLRLFLNGTEVADVLTSNRINIDNTGDLLIGASACSAPDGQPFAGLIDEVRIYGRALPPSEVQELYFAPDRILTPSTLLFLSESIDITLNSNCGTSFSWSPTAGVETPTEAEPTITPVVAGRQVYRVRIADEISSCVARDSIVLQVIDPDSLDCTQLFLPKAFTPNGIGPAANEDFGISNPFAVPELVSFEIYDRYGGQVFRTNDPFARWDGSFKGQPVNPGVMVWRVVYRCEDQEVVRSGSVTILR
ncbi:LamG-like jellyroll fold domain-containing protein [Lewinella sp. JB7]|uniref:LamG-like jellyroll fold domain-containing protein n=1 Tax=Lewinella sp. JB7 TaxID=2962887 RepID=UPI0020C94D82|nr:LamG-like jellyroll fold domain-containing protein [Lewinella sp. JB7]MCP9237088.1 gliding motility-associated C-terminal domain-containing protein [Lewinella sp. JB7]